MRRRLGRSPDTRDPVRCGWMPLTETHYHPRVASKLGDVASRSRVPEQQVVFVLNWRSQAATSLRKFVDFVKKINKIWPREMRPRVSDYAYKAFVFLDVVCTLNLAFRCLNLSKIDNKTF